MKRVIASLLLALLLAGCAKTATPPMEPSPTASPPVATTPALPEPSPSAELNPLEPFKLDERYTRWYAETVLDLIPRDDYGPIYPFIGGMTDSAFAYNGFFHDGRAKYFEGDQHGYIDTSGAVVIPAQYGIVSWRGDFQNGRAVVCGETYDWQAMIDVDGNEIVAMTENLGISMLEDGICTVNQYADQTQWFIDPDGNRLTDSQKTDGSAAVLRDYLGDGWWCLRYADGESTLRRDDVEYPVGNLLNLYYLGGDRYLVWQGMYGGLLNASGDWVVKVSLLDSLMD